jgi:hypothetical protein
MQICIFETDFIYLGQGFTLILFLSVYLLLQLSKTAILHVHKYLWNTEIFSPCDVREPTSQSKIPPSLKMTSTI